MGHVTLACLVIMTLARFLWLLWGLEAHFEKKMTPFEDWSWEVFFGPRALEVIGSESPWYFYSDFAESMSSRVRKL